MIDLELGDFERHIPNFDKAIVAAGQRAAARVFESDDVIEVTYADGRLEFFAVANIVETVTNPRRELTPMTCEAAALQGELGDELLFRIGYLEKFDYSGFIRPEGYPIPRFSHALGEALREELCELMLVR